MRVLHLIGGRRYENRIEFRERILDFVRGELLHTAASAVAAVTEEAPPPLSVIPFRTGLMALVSLDGIEDEKSAPLRRKPDGFIGSYLSEAAWPVVHQRTWPLGCRSPGAGLLTVFRRRRHISEEEFLRRWFEGHTPLTLRVHPNAGYVRNRITGFVTIPEAEKGIPFTAPDGIVEEQYDPPSDLLRPSRFFGGSLLRMLPVMLEVYRDVRGFIDYPSIHTWLTAEYRLK